MSHVLQEMNKVQQNNDVEMSRGFHYILDYSK